MGRLSNLQILLNAGEKDLRSIKSKLDPRTYAAYQRRFNADRIRKDTAQKLVNEIKLLKETKVEKKITKKGVEKIKREKTKTEKIIEEEKNIIITKLQPQLIRRERIVKKEEADDVLKDIANLFRPKIVRRKKIEKVKFYTKDLFEYANVNNDDDLYDAIQNAREQFRDATFVIIHFQNKEDNKIIFRTIKTEYFKDKKTFLDQLDKIRSGKFVNFQGVGSDGVLTEEYDTVYDKFSLASTEIQRVGFGNSDKMLFEVEGIEETKKVIRGKEVGNRDCAKVCLRKLIDDEEILKELEDTKDIHILDNLLNFLRSHSLNINVVCNSFLLKRGVQDINENNKTEEIFIKYEKAEGGMNIYGCLLNQQNDIELVYLRNIYEAESTIIYDEFNSHYDIIKNNNVVLCDKTYITNSGSIVKDNKILFSPRQINSNSFSEKKAELRYLIFDYETVIDFDKDSCMREYSLSILNLSNKELEELTTADEEKDIDTVNKIRRDRCMTFLGFDCSNEFIKWILDNQFDTAFVFIGFNNANFDNFILLDALLRFNQEHHEFSVSDIFYNGTQLLNFYMCGRHNTFDIHKHLMGSLKDNCESFKINCCAKKSFDHNKAQQLYLNGELIDFITNNEELKEYNEFDVLATAVLFCKYRRALENVEATKPYARLLHNTKTVGSLIYKVFEESKNQKKFNLPKLSYEHYKDLQKSKIAGRVELFNGVQKVEERLVSTDVCSLYPYSMSVAPVYYPCGDLKTTNKYLGADVIGFYYCDIDQSNLKAKNLPKIYARKTETENDWDYDGVLENYLISSTIIELLLKFDCKVVIKSGFFFTEKKKSCDMFDFLLDFMKAKNEEDSKKKNKDSSYNPALRETLKLLMNSLSGKVIEGLHSEKTQDVNSVAEYEKIVDKSKSINVINTIGDKVFITYEVDEETLIKKQRPIYIGVLIYDYSKRYMYENSYSKVGLKELLYTDTDASKFRYSRFLEWKKDIDDNNIQVPHWEEVEKVDERYKNHKIYESESKVFGSFEDELEGLVGEDYKFYCVEKKSWCYAVDKKAKFRFKGLNGSALLLSLGEDFIGQKQISHKATDTKEAWIENKFIVKDDTELEVYNFAQNNKNLAIENNNEVNFFEQIYNTGSAYLLCNSFRKIVKNSSRNVILGDDDKYNNLMNKIQVKYLMKKITIKK
jgi:hypothetical protein